MLKIPHNLEMNIGRQLEILGPEDDSITILRNVYKYRVAQKTYTLFTHQYLWNKL
jgi:hypothetical protein